MDNKKIIFKKIYTVIVSILAVISIIFLLLEISGKISLTASPFKEIDFCILLIFAADYIIRFFCSENKFIFFRQNIPDLLAIIPFNSLFSAFRMFRMFRLLKGAKFLRFVRFLRVGAFLSVAQKRANGILRTNGFLYILYINAALILCTSVIMVYAEGMTFFDALWWSFVTCTTVGYGDISPSSNTGRVVAVILMIFGIGLLGMLTGAITTYFTRTKTDIQNTNQETDDELDALLRSASQDERKKILEIAKIIVK